MRATLPVMVSRGTAGVAGAAVEAALCIGGEEATVWGSFSAGGDPAVIVGALSFGSLDFAAAHSLLPIGTEYSPWYLVRVPIGGAPTPEFGPAKGAARPAQGLYGSLLLPSMVSRRTVTAGALCMGGGEAAVLTSVAAGMDGALSLCLLELASAHSLLPIGIEYSPWYLVRVPIGAAPTPELGPAKGGARPAQGLYGSLLDLDRNI